MKGMRPNQGELFCGGPRGISHAMPKNLDLADILAAPPPARGGHIPPPMWRSICTVRREPGQSAPMPASAAIPPMMPPAVSPAPLLTVGVRHCVCPGMNSGDSLPAEIGRSRRKSD